MSRQFANLNKPHAHQNYVLLDCDGLINHDSDAFIKSPDEWQPIEGSLEAIALLNDHGYQVIVVTNQSGVARGLFDEAHAGKNSRQDAPVSQ